jgi:hypothetical protein
MFAGCVTIANTATVVKAVSAFRVPSPRFCDRIAKSTSVITGEKMPRAFAILGELDFKSLGETHIPLAL